MDSIITFLFQQLLWLFFSCGFNHPRKRNRAREVLASLRISIGSDLKQKKRLGNLSFRVFLPEQPTERINAGQLIGRKRRKVKTQYKCFHFFKCCFSIEIR